MHTVTPSVHRDTTTRRSHDPDVFLMSLASEGLTLRMAVVAGVSSVCV